MTPIPPPEVSQTRLMQLREAAVTLGVSAVTVRRRVRDGSLSHIRIMNRLYFRPNELHEFVEAHRGNTNG